MNEAPKTSIALPPPTLTPVELPRSLTLNVCADEILAIDAVDPDSIPAIIPLKLNDVPPWVKERLSLEPGVQSVSGVNGSMPIGPKPICTSPVEVSVVPDVVNVPSSKRLPSANCCVNRQRRSAPQAPEFGMHGGCSIFADGEDREYDPNTSLFRRRI